MYLTVEPYFSVFCVTTVPLLLRVYEYNRKQQGDTYFECKQWARDAKLSNVYQFEKWVCTFIFYSFGYAKLRSNK